MLVKSNTSWSDKQRLNTETDLYITEPQYLITDFPLLNHAGDWSFTVTIQPDVSIAGVSRRVLDAYSPTTEEGFALLLTPDATPTDGYRVTFVLGTSVGSDSLQINFTPNAKAHFTFTYNATSKTLSGYRNGQFIDSASFPAETHPLTTPDLFIGAQADLSNNYQGVLSQLAFFNKELTVVEIHNLASEVAIIPPAIHEFCVSHFPLDQRYFYKLTENSVDFVTGDVLAWDIAPQYNYAKTEVVAVSSVTTTTDLTIGTALTTPTTILAQSFTYMNDYLGDITVQWAAASIIGSPNYNLRAEILHTDSLGEPLFGSKVGVSTNTIPSSSVSPNSFINTFNFVDVTLVAGEQYVAILAIDSFLVYGPSNYINVANSPIDVYGGGVQWESSDAGVTWSSSAASDYTLKIVENQKVVYDGTHAKLFNYTDEEIGFFNNGFATYIIGTSVKDFYAKDQYVDYPELV